MVVLWFSGKLWPFAESTFAARVQMLLHTIILIGDLTQAFRCRSEKKIRGLGKSRVQHCHQKTRLQQAS